MNPPEPDSGDEDIDLTEQLYKYNEFGSKNEMSKESGETRLTSLLILLIIIIVIMIGTSWIVCFSNKTCKHQIPTMNNLLNSTFTAPFMVTGVNTAIGAHVIVVIGVYYRTYTRAASWAKIQVLFALLVYVSAAITLFVSSKTGWNHDWSNIATVILLNTWIVCVQIALRAIHVNNISKERRLLRIGLGVAILYTLLTIVFVVLRAIPVEKYVSEYDKQVGLVCSEIMSGVTLIVFVVLVVMHIRKVKYSIYYKAK